MGIATGLEPSLTLGCGTWGGNSTTNNVTYPDLSPLVPALLVVWVGLIFGFGATGAFVVATGAPPLRLFAAVAGPVLAF